MMSKKQASIHHPEVSKMNCSTSCRALLILALSTNLYIAGAYAQTVGNGTVIPLSAGEREPYGVNAGQQNADVTSAAVGGFATRHYKRGGGSGIGGSFIGTTSPTSESSPAVVRPVAVPATMQQFHLPRLQSAFSETEVNPALKTVSPALPAVPSTGVVASPYSSFARQTSTIGVEELPSFSRRESPISRMQFSRFGFGDLTK
jgi:hypothetical protein